MVALAEVRMWGRTIGAVSLSESRLLEENGRRHFMTRRFDRLSGGEKLHMQSLGGMAHFDFNLPGAYSYEQAMQVIRQLGLPMSSVEEQFRRMAFNIVARNQDDHVKNIAFLMNKQGEWRLAPAYDLTYSFNPLGAWISRHQMTLNGKREDFTLEDFKACGRTLSLKRGRAETLLQEVVDTVSQWPDYADEARVPAGMRDQIGINLRLGGCF
jgi:serine/threonine-protein kinase HipA